MKRYKLLNRDRTTHGKTKWPIGEWVEATGDADQPLCTDGWLHCYDDPYLALFLNPIHANISDPIVCEVETKGRSLNDQGLKRGYRKMRVAKDLDIERPTTEQHVTFALLCAKQVYQDKTWNTWADNWLSGKDRSAEAADSAYAAACAAAEAAACAAAGAAYAARAAAYAAAYAVEATYDARAATDAAEAAACAAADAAHAADVVPLDLVAIAKQAMLGGVS